MGVLRGAQTLESGTDGKWGTGSIRGEILKDFSAQVQQKPVLRTGFWSAFSHPVRPSGIVAISNDPSAVPTAHYIQQIAAHLTVKAHPARTLGIAGSEKRKSFLR